MREMKLQMCDLKGQYDKIKSEVDAAMQQVINSSAFINGGIVNEFATNLADYLNAQKLVTCGNGTDALQIALMTLGLKPGDEVILPVFTYVATAEVIALLGLRPVFADVELDYFTIDVTKLESLVTAKTKAIVPVHLYGQCCDMEALMQFARKHQLYVVEDAAQSLGASYTFSDGTIKKSGTIGDIGCTSFFPSKNLGCFGDGGAMIFNNVELAEKARQIANHGQQVKYYHKLVGCNSRLDSIQAAVLNVKLQHLDEYAQARNKVADFYDEHFSSNQLITLPKRRPGSSHVFHQYTIQVAGEIRDELKQKLSEQGIPSMIYYPLPLHFQEAYSQSGVGAGSFPVSEALCQKVLSLPIHTEMDEEQMRRVVNSVNQLTS